MNATEVEKLRARLSALQTDLQKSSDQFNQSVDNLAASVKEEFAELRKDLGLPPRETPNQ